MARASKTKAKVSKKKTTKKKAAKAAPSPLKIVYLSFSAEINTKTVEQLLAFCSGKTNDGYE